MGFNFRLQSILKLRIQNEKNVEEKLGKAIKKYDKEKMELNELQSRAENEMDNFVDIHEDSVPVSLLRRKTIFISHLEKLRALKEENVNKEKENVDKVREELINAVHERKIIERFKEKKHLEYIKTEKQKEQKIIDEIVSFRQQIN